MSRYGETNVKIDALKNWVNQLSTDNINLESDCDMDDKGEQLKLTKKIVEDQLLIFRSLVNGLEPSEDWKKCLGCLSSMAYNTFFKVKNGAIRIANYYECLVKPGNSKTHKRIIHGYDHLTIGEVNFYHETELIGTLGQKSDLIWSVFYDYFVCPDESGSINYAYENHEKYLSLQLYNVDNKNQEEIDHIVTEMLLRCSIEHGLDFEIIELDETYRMEGKANKYSCQFRKVEYEYVPSLYFNNALRINDVRLSFLSFYQVMEFFFVRTQNYAFLSEYGQMPATIDHNMLRNILNKYKNSLSERESLKLVLKRGLDITAMKNWVLSSTEYTSLYCSNTSWGLDFSKTDEKIINKLAERIYTFRCAIAHAKGNIDEYIAVPILNNDDIANALPLIKYIAYEILKVCSEV